MSVCVCVGGGAVWMSWTVARGQKSKWRLSNVETGLHGNCIITEMTKCHTVSADLFVVISICNLVWEMLWLLGKGSHNICKQQYSAFLHLLSYFLTDGDSVVNKTKNLSKHCILSLEVPWKPENRWLFPPINNSPSGLLWYCNRCILSSSQMCCICYCLVFKTGFFFLSLEAKKSKHKRIWLMYKMIDQKIDDWKRNKWNIKHHNFTFPHVQRVQSWKKKY